MNDEMATEWLAVAAAEVSEINPRAFHAGCAEARKTCSHHGQIIPTILNGKEAKWYRSIGALLAPAKQVQEISQDSRVTALIESAADRWRHN